jgi:NAD(P)-dependent dehydrogenase (short-subunit alcohol dehydrogenase family)
MLKGCVALVTGVSSGIGWATAELLARHGFRVFGTMRRPGENAPSGVEILPLDVREEASVRSCVDRVVASAGRLDLLVNNAGVALYGALEEVSIEQARAVFETNFFGVLRMTQAVLPLMREQGRGRIVNVGSVAGFLPIPFEGIYVASKHALEGYSETLDLEVRRFGIHVSLIEPSFIRTDIDRNTTIADRPLAAYEEQRQRTIEVLRRSVETGNPPTMVAHAVLSAATSPKPRRRYLVGRDARVLRSLRTLLPPRWFEWGLRRRFHLG